tara:strand:+ start:469 stop:1461 length:993 start_codon:yes stop_codon:yes gene_type:complete
MFKNKSILITGGTGSFGKAFAEYLIKYHKNLSRLVIFSRDELKQFEMSNEKRFLHPNIRYFLGDVRDLSRLKRAMDGIDIIVHAAALKQVPSAEYNPFEYIKTNIIGAQNIIEAALDCGVKKVVALSTDKAASPINLYGATKLCSDKLFISANNIKGKNPITFSVVRYGNVTGSRGSVIPFFLKQNKKNKKLPLTDVRMTRFNISLEDSIELVVKCLKKSIGGEIYVPKIPSFYIKDLIEAISKKNNFRIVGIRPGEKIHEELISVYDSMSTLEFKDHYVVLPQSNNKKINAYFKKAGGKNVKYGFSYTSVNNNKFLSVQSIKKILKKIK